MEWFLDQNERAHVAFKMMEFKGRMSEIKHGKRLSLTNVTIGLMNFTLD